ncbi:MAG: B12-binding domain-containing radical SAM protein [Deltaproteobacteria bacterium HGW-Deltaproteobacteria-10]|nr:MAG: B12-binding domain-containing radical SAM protein [Deltaproteobacteria bacterium HGW-Deltaproteobacteria-10]
MNVTKGPAVMKASILHRPIKKVILIFPPMNNPRIYAKQCCMPMGIAYLGAVLRDHYDVRLLDAVVEGHHLERDITPQILQYGLDTDMIMERVREFAPDVVGMSCLFSHQFSVVAGLAKKVKDWNPEVITITGGTHPTFLPERCLREEALDYIVMGEAEESLPALLKAIETGSGHGEIDGLAFRTNDGQVIHPKTSWIKDLDSLPFPARDLLPLQKYFDINIPINFFSKSPLNISFISSRGCPFRCNFCSSSIYWGSRYRARSPENVLAELEHLKNVYGIEEIKFEDDNLTLDTKRAKAIFRGMIERKLNLSWNMPNGVMVKTLADHELVRLMKQSGCYEVILAFESGDQWVLDNIVNKPLDLEAARGIVRNLKREGIDTHSCFIIGFPGEKLAQIKNTFAYAHSLNLDKMLVFFFKPLPGTPLYKECLERGLINADQCDENSFVFSGISDQDWTPEILEKLYRHEELRFLFSLLFRRPGKFFGKYLRPRLRPNQIRTIYYWFVDRFGK